jgi:hypothetical protein
MNLRPERLHEDGFAVEATFSRDADFMTLSKFKSSECKGGGKFVGKWDVNAYNTTLCPICRSRQPVTPYGGRFKIVGHEGNEGLPTKS